jgi:adenylate kinase family enzyme
MRVHIIGGPGSGKTYIARQLSERYGIPAFDLDHFFWDRNAGSYGVKASVVHRDQALRSAVERDSWIIEGVYHQWLAPSFVRAHVILGLTTPVWVRHSRIVRRFARRKLGLERSKRESLKDLWMLLKWNHAYDQDNLVRARNMVEEMGLHLTVCRTTDEAVAALNTLARSCTVSSKPQDFAADDSRGQT